MHARAHVCLRVCVPMYMYKWMYVGVCTYIYIYMHIYIERERDVRICETPACTCLSTRFTPQMWHRGADSFDPVLIS